MPNFEDALRVQGGAVGMREFFAAPAIGAGVTVFRIVPPHWEQSPIYTSMQVN
jgi:hypothetical protein